jgi:hypothetical protein
MYNLKRHQKNFILYFIVYTFGDRFESNQITLLMTFFTNNKYTYYSYDRYKYFPNFNPKNKNYQMRIYKVNFNGKIIFSVLTCFLIFAL